jgi:methyl acetate hydrolase
MRNRSIQNLLDHTLKRTLEEQKLPGLVAAVTTDEGVLYEAAFGQRDLSTNSPMTIDTACYIASMIKPLIATAAMQCVERGKLKLDSPVIEIVPELENIRVLEGFYPDGYPILREHKREITLWHLLTHTSGLSYDFWEASIARYMTEFDLSAVPDVLLHDPGERWTYGTSMTWVGRMIERVNGQSLQEYMFENIFGPLGISSISMDPVSRQNQLAIVYRRDRDGNLKSVPSGIETRLGLGRSAWYATAGDYLRFLQALIHGGKIGRNWLLQPGAVELMLQNQIGDANVLALKTIRPEYSNDVCFYPDMKQKWGYGFLINTERTPEGRSAGSAGWVGIANTFFWVDLRQRTAGVFLSQVLPLFDRGSIQAYRHFERVVNSLLQ